MPCLVALVAGNVGGNGPHQHLAHLNSSPHHMESLSVGNHVPHHHQEWTNWGSLARLEGPFPAKLRSKATRYASIISRLLLVT